MREVVLTQNMELVAYRALMKVAVEDPRHKKEILPFLKLMEEEGTMDSASVNRKYFQKEMSGHPFGPHWLQTLHQYGLVEPTYRGDHIDYRSANFRLSGSGRMMAREGMVLLPQEDEFVLHITRSPLVPDGLLSCYPGGKTDLRSGWKDEIVRRKANGAGKGKDEKMIDFPSELQELWRGRSIALPAQNMSKVQIIEVMGKAIQEVPTLAVKARIHLMEDGSSRITLHDGKNEVPMAVPFPLTYEKVLMAMAERRDMGYDPQSRRLMLSSEQLTDQVVSSFSIQLPKSKIEVSNYGVFDILPVSDIPARPGDISSAMRWIDSLVLSRVSDYTDREHYEGIRLEAINLMSEWFDTGRLQEGTRDYFQVLTGLLETGRERDDLFWHIVTAHDLDGERVKGGAEQ